MSATALPPAPSRPGDLPHDATLRELLDAYHDHLAPVINARLGGDFPHLADELTIPPRAEVAAHAVALLAVEHALAARLLAGRWATVVDALHAGATLDQVAAAMDLDVDEVTVGLRSWAYGELQLHRELGIGLSEDEHDQVLALLSP